MARQALIVGASGGIGRGLAERLGRDGWTILAQGRRPDALERTLASIESAGGSGEAFQAELTDPSSVQALADWAVGHGPLDAVVWSAAGGRAVPTGPESFAEWDRCLAASLHAPMRLTALTLPAVRQARGSYLYVCGLYATMGVGRMAAHCAARHGLAGFAKALFEEVRGDGIGVSLLHPGFVATSLINTEKIDPAQCIQIADIAEAATLALTLPNTACVTEMTIRPQRSPYRSA